MSLLADDLDVAAVTASDVADLTSFRCSTGPEWEQEVEEQINGPLPHRYLQAAGGSHDPRMLVVRHDGSLIAVAAHRIESPPRLINRQALCPRYLEVIAVSLTARGQQVSSEGDGDRSVGTFAFDAAISDIHERGEDRFIFGRVDPQHTISLTFCDRVGLTVERPDTDSRYLQRWGTL